MLVTILHSHGPARSQEVSETNAQIEVEIELLPDDFSVDISNNKAATTLRIRNQPPARLYKIVTNPQSCPCDITADSLIDRAAERIANHFKISTEQPASMDIGNHVTELQRGDCIIDRRAMLGGHERRKKNSTVQRAFKARVFEY